MSLRNAPVTPSGDHPAIALRSQTLKFCTKAQWHRRKVWNPRHHTGYNGLQYTLDSLITLSLRPMCSQFDHQCAPNALPLRSVRSYCVQVAFTAVPQRSQYVCNSFTATWRNQSTCSPCAMPKIRKIGLKFACSWSYPASPLPSSPPPSHDVDKDLVILCLLCLHIYVLLNCCTISKLCRSTAMLKIRYTLIVCRWWSCIYTLGVSVSVIAIRTHWEPIVNVGTTPWTYNERNSLSGSAVWT